MKKALSYKPSVYYFRKELREAEAAEELRELGLGVVAELEMLKAWVRAQGLVPPHWHITPSERAAKAPGLVIPYRSTKPESETAS